MTLRGGAILEGVAMGLQGRGHGVVGGATTVLPYQALGVELRAGRGLGLRGGASSQDRANRLQE